MSSSGGLTLDETALSVLSAVPPHLVRRPDGVPGWVTAGAVLWEQRTLRRVVGMRAEPGSVRIAAMLVSETCAAWPVADLRSVAVECAAALVAGSVAATAGAGGRNVFLLLSVAGPCLIVEVCECEARWPSDGEQWEAARSLAAQAGGEFGLVCGPHGRGVFIALPLPPQPIESLDEWALETVAGTDGGPR